MDNEIEIIPAESSLRRLSEVRKLWVARSWTFCIRIF